MGRIAARFGGPLQPGELVEHIRSIHEEEGGYMVSDPGEPVAS